MVATLEIVFLIVVVVLAVWWFTRTNAYRSRVKSGSEPGQHGSRKRRDDDAGQYYPKM